MFRLAELLRTALSRTLRKAPQLLVLYLVVGATGILLLDAAFDYTWLLYGAIGAIYALFWTGAEVITLNLLTESVERDTSIAAMYETSYRGIGWTTGHLLLGWLIYGAAVFVALLPALLELFTVTPFTTAPVVSIGITAGSTVLAGYIALRLLLFPVHVAVENMDAVTALRTSSAMTTDHVGTMTAALLAVVGVMAVAGYGLIAVSQTVLPQTALAAVYPYLLRTVEGVAVALIAGLGTVSKLACITAAHDTIADAD